MLRNSFTSDSCATLPSCTEGYRCSGGNDNASKGRDVGGAVGGGHVLCYNTPGEWPSCALLGVEASKVSKIPLEPRRADHATALQGACTLPTGLVNYPLNASFTPRETKAPPGRWQWHGVLEREMDGCIRRNSSSNPMKAWHKEGFQVEIR